MDTNTPEFAGIARWLNTKPLSARQLRGKVVLIDFWTYTCVNCLRTIPYLKKWHDKYKRRGFTVVGVHSPEFEFEKDADNVAAAVKKLEINYPVAVDSSMKTWEAFKNTYWPCHYLVDASGKIRRFHAGEGAYTETEAWIVKLLGEAGSTVKKSPEKQERPNYNPKTTLETYCGSARNRGLGNGEVCLPDGTCRYVDPEKHEKNMIYLDGNWTQEKEYLVNKGPGHITFVFSAKSMNVVMAPVDGMSVVGIKLDGKPIDRSNSGMNVKKSAVAVNRPDMYSVVNRKEFGTYRICLNADKPTKFFAFTFG